MIRNTCTAFVPLTVSVERPERCKLVTTSVAVDRLDALE